jgi:hypothetical protein
MMDLDTIREFQAEAASIAAKAKQKPYLVETSDVGNIESLRRLPNLGTYLPEGWARVDPIEVTGEQRNRHASGTIGETEGRDREVSKYWVDKSGFGSEDELALTIREMAALLRPGYGYAIVEEGQFQLGIGVFKKL